MELHYYINHNAQQNNQIYMDNIRAQECVKNKNSS